MMSSRAKYALRAMVFLTGEAGRDRWTLTGEIAAATEVPRKFLEAILVELRDHNLVVSQRGRYGGYRLARPAETIHAGDVLRIVDGPLALAPCVSRTQPGTCLDCVDAATCPLRAVLQAARDAVADVLDGRSLAHMLGDAVRFNTDEPLSPAPPLPQRTGSGP